MPSIDPPHREIRAEERRLPDESAILHALGDAVIVIDEVGTLQYANESAERLLGYSLAERIGTNILEYIHPNDVERAAQAATSKASTEGVGAPIEVRVRKDDGDWLVVEAVGNAVFTDPAVGGNVLVIRDITERASRVDSPERLSALLNNSSDLLLLVDGDGRIIYCSQTLSRVLGRDSYLIKGYDFTSIVHPYDVDEFEQVLEELRHEPQGGAALTIRLLPTEGETRTFAVKVENQIDDPLIKGFIVTASDISELTRAKDKAEAAAQAKADFLANVSHEIRTPLNAIVGLGELLAETRLDSLQRDHLDTIRSSSDSLLSTINQILEFSKLDSGHVEPEVSSFALGGPIEAAVGVVAKDAAAKGLDIRQDVAEHQSTVVRGDEGRWRQILLNLLDNAVKFTEEGSVTVSTSVRPLGDTGAEVTVAVSDTGSGIEKDVQERLFGSFSQGDSSSTREHGGLGLGLGISSRLAGLLGGRISLDSTPGRGSTFYVSIPFEVEAKGPIGRYESGFDGRRVLVVDDTDHMLELLRGHLESWGLAPVMAKNAHEALQILDRSLETPLDAAILDADLPGTTDLRLAEEIRKTHPDLPLIVLPSMGKKVSTGHLAPIALVPKPVKASTLYDALAGHFELDRATEHPAAESAADDEGRGQPHSILIVDDNAVNLKVGVAMLKKLGYSPETATNGVEALDSLRRRAYDIVFMDIQMPEMSGDEAIRRIRAEWPSEQQPHIIVLTANALDGDREHFLALGADDYLAKPVRLEDLERVLGVAPPPKGERVIVT